MPSATVFPFCAKGGHAKDTAADGCFVCLGHWNTEGLYTHCANCGKELPEESRKWVHPEHRR
jgi:hypothetical protein